MGKWWLITWTTYGTWLPGDPRGFQTWRGETYVPPPKRYAKPGERTYRPEEYKFDYEIAQRSMVEDPVRLTIEQCRIAVDAIVSEVAQTSIVPAILAIGSEHSHFLAKFGALKIRPAVGKLKAAATRELHEYGIGSENVWTQGCRMKSKSTPQEFGGAFEYVLRHEQEGAVVYIWRDVIELPEAK